MPITHNPADLDPNQPMVDTPFWAFMRRKRPNNLVKAVTEYLDLPTDSINLTPRQVNAYQYKFNHFWWLDAREGCDKC